MSTTHASEYRVANPPRFWAMREWDCALCEHDALKAPVFIEGPGGVRAYGSCCALKVLGRSDTKRARKELVAEAYHVATAAIIRGERSDRAYRILTIAAMTGTHPTEVMGRIGEGPGMLANFHQAKREGRATSVAVYLSEVERTGEI